MTKAPELLIDPDIGPIGPRRRAVERWPREYTTVTLPLALPYVGDLTVPRRMTEFEWDNMLRALAIMKPGLVPPEPTP